MNEFCAALRELGFNPPAEGVSYSWWMWKGGFCDSVSVEFKGGIAYAHYSCEHCGEDSDLSWQGPVSELESFRAWFESI